MRHFLRRLRRTHRPAFAALWILVALYGAAFLADCIAPYPYDLQNRAYSLCPPTPVRFRETGGGLHLRPFVYRVELENPALNTYRTDRTTIHPVRLFVTGPTRKLLGIIPSQRYLFGTDDTAPIFLFGTDMNGRDIFSRIIYGSRISLSIGILGVSISFLLGLLIGGISGYFGGRTDTILMRTVEIVMTFPAFYLLLALRATFPTNLSSVQIYLLITVILSFIGWASLARIIRGMVLSLKEEEYVLAARSLGLSRLRIIIRHILPNTLSYTVTALTLSVPGYILGESGLSLIGLGIQEPFPSWGNMLAVTIGNLRILTTAPWMLLPGFFIFLTIISFNFLGDGLRDVMDPSGKTG